MKRCTAVFYAGDEDEGQDCVLQADHPGEHSSVRPPQPSVAQIGWEAGLLHAWSRVNTLWAEALADKDENTAGVLGGLAAELENELTKSETWRLRAGVEGR